MIPWIASYGLQLGSLHFQTWGVLVAVGFLFATSLAVVRANRLGLLGKLVWDIAFWVFLAAMLGSRLFHALFYEPQYFIKHPWKLIDPSEPGYAIMGGILGGAFALWAYAKKKGLDLLAYADVVAWSLPFGFAIGRIGCFLIHDHPGTTTTFFLGVKYPDGVVRHDLGLELALFGLFLGLVFLLVDFIGPRLRLPIRARGWWVGLFLVLDGIGRFALDFLRVVDRRYGGLTPTQWLLIASVFIGGVFLKGAYSSHQKPPTV